ncbi:ribose 5-phosphate isomerase B [Desulforhopalus singaporensis]|uniref:Ribose 5-phosphate isomerase B n=1 Tax=Desulforhopalus singaporensis TaxID=91360 RepID=A0A1H0MNF9_9BACT|nr:ribose 5-phosphate isomerase B [Desulforhopalus singaporensis]SDO81690.1 ribose 5-phosphate isomerase B [Desulforhopalus singaporensis]
MKIVVAADHGGYELKQKIKAHLADKGVDLVDEGCFSGESVDYPDFANKAVAKIVGGDCQRGVLICGTGIGMSIVANRNMAIRAALCHDVHTARMSREHNDANVLCLGARILSVDDALAMVDTWLETEFSGGRHQRRIEKFSR